MRRLVSILVCAAMFAAPAIAAAPASPVRATVLMLWTAADPQSALADVRAMDVALRAPFEVGAPARALRLHSGARFAISLSPSYASALALAGSNPLGAATLATGERTDPRTRDIALLLATMPPLRAQQASTPGARELATLTSAAQRWLAAGANSRLSTDEIRRAAGLNAAVRLTNAGSAAASALLAHPPAATAALLSAANQDLLEAVNAAVKDSRDAAARGDLEFVATPDGAPVLPLLVDSGGKTMSDPSVLPLNAAADASAMIDDALAGVSSLAGHRGAGLLAPFGAYDDASAQLIAARGARFAVYSDRVLQTSQAGGSVDALRSARASSYQTYGLQIGKTGKLPLYFWADGPSRALDGLATTQPPESFAARVMADASDAGATSFDGTSRVITLRVELGGPWAQRPDAGSLIDRLAGALSRWGADATPSGYLKSHRTAIGAYGFAPGSTLGALGAFTALPNQTVMWAALAQAREAAGGDAGLKKTAVRTPLLRAESGTWFLLPTSTPKPVAPSPLPSATKPGARRSGYPQGL